MVINYNCKDPYEWNEESDLRSLVRQNNIDITISRLLEVLIKDGKLSKEQVGTVLGVEVLNFGPRPDDQ